MPSQKPSALGPVIVIVAVLVMLGTAAMRLRASTRPAASAAPSAEPSAKP